MTIRSSRIECYRCVSLPVLDMDTFYSTRTLFQDRKKLGRFVVFWGNVVDEKLTKFEFCRKVIVFPGKLVYNRLVFVIFHPFPKRLEFTGGAAHPFAALAHFHQCYQHLWDLAYTTNGTAYCNCVHTRRDITLIWHRRLPSTWPIHSQWGCLFGKVGRHAITGQP